VSLVGYYASHLYSRFPHPTNCGRTCKWTVCRDKSGTVSAAARVGTGGVVRCWAAEYRVRLILSVDGFSQVPSMDRRGAATRRLFCLEDASARWTVRRFLSTTGGQPLAAFCVLVLKCTIMASPPLLTAGEGLRVGRPRLPLGVGDLWCATRVPSDRRPARGA
jgi:hypothetical protein